MTSPSPKSTKAFPTTQALHNWFLKHHASETELWIQVYKKSSDVQSVAWEDIVDECLCWGWIDGLKNSLDESSYLQRVTPRKKKSPWSKRNRQRVAMLLEQGRMKPEGQIQVDAAKADGRWEEAYTASENTVPGDFIEALAKHSVAKDVFDQMTKSQRFVIAHGLNSAKKPETRRKRFCKYLDKLKSGEKPVSL